MTENHKRTYTVPVLLVIIFVMSILLVLSYSKYLFSEQSHRTDTGQRLAEEYSYALVFADQLQEGTNLLLEGKTEVDRIRAMKHLGMAMLASGEASRILHEAVHLDSGQERKEVSKPILEAIHTIVGLDSTLARLGEQEGPPTEAELAELERIREGMEQFKAELARFTPPSGEAGYRQMVTLGEWIAPALDATEHLYRIAAELQQ